MGELSQKQLREQLVNHAEAVYKETVVMLSGLSLSMPFRDVSIEDVAALAIWAQCQQHSNPITILKDRNGDWRFQ